MTFHIIQVKAGEPKPLHFILTDYMPDVLTIKFIIAGKLAKNNFRSIA